ncbi:MAG TPA: M14 metallopeptidase family protein [Gemmatimonadales bacterium]|nr:M14 metallopeptidase family protein [Gemmatimonadales bacterium]
MLTPRRAGAALALVAVVAATPLAAQQHPRPRRPAPARHAAPKIPTPKSILGFDPGDDRKLPDWPALVRYFRALADASDRVDYRELGKSTLGAPFIAVVISSPQNLKRLGRFRDLNARLADPRTLSNNREAENALRDGRTVVLLTSGVHSNEVGGSLSPVALAYRLATDTSAATRAILDNVILWLVPSVNPDGVSIVTHWYNRTLGTGAEGTSPPELYHHYVGHDLNRDWYAFTQAESQIVADSLYDVWHPQIVMDLHQQGPNGSRLFLPPYLDPIEPNVDPLLVDGDNALGSAMAWDLAGLGRTGVAINALYDAWTPSRAFAHYHGAVRILCEAASADLASPVDIPFDQLSAGARGFNPRERSWNFPQPWPGGRWTIRDIVGYQTDAAYAMLQHAAANRSEWLSNFLSVGWRGVRGWRGWPYAYVIPKQQDSIALATLFAVLHHGGVEIRTATQGFGAGGSRYPAGTYIVSLRQPYAAFAKTLLEPQVYPDRRQYPGGPPERPYDVTANTLPLLLGVTANPIDDPGRLQLSAPIPPPRATPGYPGFGPGVAPRVAVYRSYDATMDEGWTRWVFDTWKVPYLSIVDSTVRAGGLKARFDVIVLPDQSPHALLEGLPGRYPAPFAGGLGTAGVDALRQFVQEGGTLVALNDASRFLIQTLLLPVRNVLEGVPDDEFYAPGSIFRMELDTSAAEARGMPPKSIAWYEGGPAFDVLDSTQVRVIGRYPTDPGALLLSGWVLHPERVAGRAALVEVKVGQGRAILFGFRPQYRGQSVASYPLLFNSLQVR